MKTLLNLKTNDPSTHERRMDNLRRISLFVIGSATLLVPLLVFGSVESSLEAVQEKLVGTLLPLAAMCGLAIAGLSFVMGHPNAKQHFLYAMFGAAVGFGAESIVSFIRGIIH